jgi:hypothetical protein
MPYLSPDIMGGKTRVFRWYEANRAIRPQIATVADGGDLYYTWFRTLALAYLLTVINKAPVSMVYARQFKRAPGTFFILCRPITREEVYHKSSGD